jgi:hypothetical protein
MGAWCHGPVLRELFFSGDVDSVGVDGTIAESLKMTARLSPNAMVSASKIAVNAKVRTRDEYCKPIALFITVSLACNRRAVEIVSQAPILFVDRCAAYSGCAE